MDEKDYITIEEFEKLYENIDTSKITIEKMKETEKLIVEGPISIVYQLLKGNNFIEEIMIDKNINDPKTIDDYYKNVKFIKKKESTNLSNL